MPPAGERRPISNHNRKRDGPCGPSLFLWERDCYIRLHILDIQLPEQGMLLLAAAKDILRHLLGTVRDFRSRQLTSADQPKGPLKH